MDNKFYHLGAEILLNVVLIALTCIITACAKGIETNSVTSLELNTETLSMSVGQKDILFAIIYPKNAGNKKVSWSSSNESVATVSDESVATVIGGRVTAVGVGVANIIAKTHDGNFSASCTVSVTDNVSENETPSQGEEETPSQGEGEGETGKVKSMTITLEKVKATKAYFKASTKKTSPDIEIGVYYSTDSGEHIYDCERVYEYDLENGECDFIIDDLDANTTYYYRPYISMNGIIEFGEERTFSTTDYFCLAEAIVDDVYVTFTGDADLPNGGIIYSTDPSLTVDNCIAKITDLQDEYSYTLRNLSGRTTYYYCSYYYSDEGVYVYGTIKSFTTGDDKYSSAYKYLSSSSAINLSDMGASNCYIVSKSGLYKLRTVKGKEVSQNIENISTAAILWESFGTDIQPKRTELIQAIYYEDGYLIFETSDTYKEGNAVIAVMDSESNILWSWHIWLTDEPQEHIYLNDAGIMMDRNLGATSASPGEVEALGLLYQWGRKDPLLGSSSINESIVAKSTITWKAYHYCGSIADSNAHPTTIELYGNISSWNEFEDTKSIYDPCPVGWRVPNTDIWKNVSIKDNKYYNGILLDINSPLTTWYPYSGGNYDVIVYYPNTYDYRLSGVGSVGKYWSTEIYSSSYAYHVNLNSNSSLDYNKSEKECAYPVRCQKE